MRLLAVDGWVFKTNEWHCSKDLQSVKQSIEIWKERGRTLKIWHPQKYWFILRQEDIYWACNATPRLVTLPDIGISLPGTSKLDRIELMVRWSLMNLRILFRHGLMLDLKIDNFGIAEGSKQLYYVDDEVYRFESWRDFFRGPSHLLS
jgi:hypothetical protein